MELSSPKIKEVLVFSQKKKLFSCILGNETP